MEDEEPGEVPEEQSTGWQLRWGHILLALFVIVAIVGTLTLFHDSGNNCKSDFQNACSSTTNGQNGSHNQHKHSSTSTSPKASTPSTAKQSTPSTSPGQPNGQSADSSSQGLANSGPGDVVGLFLGIVLSAAGLYSLHLRRRMKTGLY